MCRVPCFGKVSPKSRFLRLAICRSLVARVFSSMIGIDAQGCHLPIELRNDVGRVVSGKLGHIIHIGDNYYFRQSGMILTFKITSCSQPGSL